MKKLVTVLSIFFFVALSAQEESEIKEINTEENTELSDVPFALVEEAPIHPDCVDKSNSFQKKQCMNQMMMKHIQRHFNVKNVMCLKKEYVKNEKTGKEEEQCTEKLSSGRKRIITQFKIGLTGELEDIQVRGPHPILAVEAKRVLSLVPKMIPGKQRGKPIKVRYMLPIIFTVQ